LATIEVTVNTLLRACSSGETMGRFPGERAQRVCAGHLFTTYTSRAQLSIDGGAATVANARSTMGTNRACPRFIAAFAPARSLFPDFFENLFRRIFPGFDL
jgi:hypothetical protein